MTKPKKVTLDWIKQTMGESTTAYHHFPGTTVTVCLVTLPSGYTLVGHGACINEEDFDEGLCQQISLDDALSKLWALEGYRRKLDES